MLAGVFSPVLLRDATLIPHAPGAYHDGPYGYAGPKPGMSVLDPWGPVWIEVPGARLVRSQAAAGEVPLWNPLVACGTPLAAGMHSQAFSPLRWLLFLNPAPYAWDLFFLLRLLVAGALTAALCSTFKLGAAASLAGGGAYMLGGYLIAYLNLFHLDVDVFLPGLLLCVVKLLGGGGLVWKAALTAVTAQMFLGGNPQAALVDFAFAFVFAAVLPGRKGLGRLVLPVGAGAALAAPLLVPFAEFFAHAFHVHGEQAGSWWGGTVLPWQGFPSLFVPVSFGPVFQPDCFPVQALLPYVGVGVLILGLQGVGFAPWRRMSWLLAVVAGLELAKIYGVPPFNWMGRLPGLSLIVWVKYAAPLFMSLALLAAFGARRVMEGAGSRGRLAAAAGVLALAAVTAYVLRGWHAPFAAGWGLALAVTAAWGFFIIRSRRLGAGAEWVVPILLAVELAAWVPSERARVHDPLRPAPYVSFLKVKASMPGGPRVFGLGFNLVPHLGAVAGLSDPRTVDPLIFEPYWTFMDREVIPSRPRPFLGFLLAGGLDESALEALSFLGVRYLFSTWEPGRFLRKGTTWPLTKVFDGRMNVFRNPRAYPRAFVLSGSSRPVPARIASYHSQEVVVKTSGRAGRLVLTDAAFPGWRAYRAPGSRLRIERFREAFRSVEVSAGTEEVRFVYVPVSFSLGLLTAALAAGAISMALLFVLGRRRWP